MFSISSIDPLPPPFFHRDRRTALGIIACYRAHLSLIYNRPQRYNKICGYANFSVESLRFKGKKIV